MLRLLIALALLAPTAALAGNNDCQWNPPARFQGKPTVAFKVIKKAQPKIQAICASELSKRGFAVMPDYRGCTVPKGNSWIVYVAKGGYKCATEQAILTHEIGHINGWTDSHED